MALTTPLPTTLGGVSVTVKDSAGVEKPAALFFVAPGQINFLVPAQLAPGAATVSVNGLSIPARGTVEIAASAPGLFSANADSKGAALGAVVTVLADGTQRFEPLAQFDETQKRFVPRPFALPSFNQSETKVLVLYGTGLRALRTAKVMVGGVSLPVEFVGAQPQLAGLDQVNLRLPFPFGGPSLPEGQRLNVALSADGVGTANVVEIETALTFQPADVRIDSFEPPRARGRDGAD